MSALVLDGVGRTFDVGGERLVALADVHLCVPDGQVLALVGPSGSGKTTLLSIAGGLLTPTSGRVVVGGQDISRATPRQLTAFRRRRVGFIFQAVNLIPFLTARENLLVVAELAGRDPRAAERRADRLLDELGLGHRRQNLPDQLSGGERQRVAIGRALMNEPALVLVDEPTASLDTRMGEQVMRLIVEEVTSRGAAAVVVTHDPRMAAYATAHRTIGDGRLDLPPPPPGAAPVRTAAPPTFAGPMAAPSPRLVRPPSRAHRPRPEHLPAIPAGRPEASAPPATRTTATTAAESGGEARTQGEADELRSLVEAARTRRTTIDLRQPGRR